MLHKINFHVINDNSDNKLFLRNFVHIQETNDSHAISYFLILFKAALILASDINSHFKIQINSQILYHNTIKRAEAHIGPTFEETSKASCIKAIVEERNLTLGAHRYLYF